MAGYFPLFLVLLGLYVRGSMSQAYSAAGTPLCPCLVPVAPTGPIGYASGPDGSAQALHSDWLYGLSAAQVRRQNMNAQSQINQSQGPIGRRQNMNAQSQVSQTGRRQNMNAQSAVSQISGDSPVAGADQALSSSLDGLDMAQTRRQNLNAQSGVSQRRQNMNVQSDVSQTAGAIE